MSERPFDPFSEFVVNPSQPIPPNPSGFLGSAGNEELGRWFETYRPRLEQIVAFRMDPSMRKRLDPSDVVQESFFHIARRIEEFARESPVPLFVWIRQRVLQTLIDLQRTHCRDKRSVHREARWPDPYSGQSTSYSIAAVLMDRLPSPSQVAIQAEEQARLQVALDSMNETDREVLALRHFEHLTNQEVADILGIGVTAASNRYVRAAAKLSEILQFDSWASRVDHDR